MTPFDQVVHILRENVQALSSEHIHIASAHARILASDIQASMALPPVAHSAMDGFAVRAEDTKKASTHTPTCLTIKGTMVAGSDPQGHSIASTQAYQITTGALLPQGADAVVQQEHTHRHGDDVFLENPIATGKNVRPIGEWLPNNTLIGKTHQNITPSMAAMIAMMGLNQVEVLPRPRICLMTCGDEIVTPGEPRKMWQMYDGNSIMLSLHLKQMGIEHIHHVHLPDEPDLAKQVALKHAKTHDLLLTAGGASVGARDIFRQLSTKTTPFIQKVAQRPGKPLFFTRLEGTLWMGLPGPPLAAYVNALTHLTDLIYLLQGRSTKPWRPLETPCPLLPHASQMRLILAKQHSKTMDWFEGQSAYETMLSANTIVALDPDGQAMWRTI